MRKETDIKLLDHGYIRFIEDYGSDESIIEAARMSTNKGFLGWKKCPECDTYLQEAQLHTSGPGVFCPNETEVVPADEKLLEYLYENKHHTPFEMAGMIIEVQAPIFVFREWHRHRTQCLAGDTMLHFEAPKSERHGRRYVYKMPLAEAWRKWQPTMRSNRPERQENALWSRSRVANMRLRCVNEETGEVTLTHVVDIVRGNQKQLFRVTTLGGKTIRASADHRFFTNNGWLRLEDAVRHGAMLAVERTAWGTTADNANDRVVSDRQQRLTIGFEEIESVREDGLEITYDVAVADPWHNFVADGFCVHNSYNELSARYTPLPDLNYVPTLERCMINAGQSNKQAGTISGSAELTEECAEAFRSKLQGKYDDQQEFYEWALRVGIPKELARIDIPVGRYSRMRANANLRNWLAFLTLRMAPNAQWEIRQYANGLADLIQGSFPRTFDLFISNFSKVLKK